MIRLASALLGAMMLMAAGASAAEISVDEALKDRVLGDPKAPVTIIEYASLACPHCAEFHEKTLPKLKKDYIDTGKVKLIFRDFPFDGRAFMAAMMARCAPPERYFPFIAILFENQKRWAQGEEFQQTLMNIGKLGGVDEKTFEACITNKALFAGMRKIQTDATQQLGVDATPSFVINGRKIVGARSYETFVEAIEQAAR